MDSLSRFSRVSVCTDRDIHTQSCKAKHTGIETIYKTHLLFVVVPTVQFSLSAEALSRQLCVTYATLQAALMPWVVGNFHKESIFDRLMTTSANIHCISRS